MTQSPSFFARNIASRFLNTVVCPPLEVLQILGNTLKLPLQAASIAVKIPAKLINLAINSKTLREFDNQLSGPLDLLKTALKIVGLAIGTLTTILLGTLSPMANFKFHYALNLVKDEKIEAQLAAKALEAQRKKEAYEKVLEEQIRKVTEALKLKIMESVPPPTEAFTDQTTPSNADEITFEKPAERTTEIIPFEATEVDETSSEDETDSLIDDNQVANAE